MHLSCDFGLGRSEPVPDACTISPLREKPIRAGASKILFARFEAPLGVGVYRRRAANGPASYEGARLRKRPPDKPSGEGGLGRPRPPQETPSAGLFSPPGRFSWAPEPFMGLTKPWAPTCGARYMIADSAGTT
jgi:hypothetical protein